MTQTTSPRARQQRRAAFVCAVLTCCFWWRTAGAAVPSDRVLVMPFENVTRDPKIFWLGEGAAVLLTDDLLARGVDAITRQERQQAFDRLQVPPAASLTDATVIRLGQLVGAAEVVVGSLEMDGEALVLHARGIALEAGRVRVDATERGALPDLFAIVNRIAQRFAPPNAPPIGQDEPSLPVFENFIKGVLAETPDTASAYLNAALKLQPTFDRARIALWQVYDDEGEYAQALAAVRAVQPGSPLAARASFLAGLSQLYLKKYDEAYATFRALAESAPAANVWNDLGVVQMRRGATPQTGSAAESFKKAAEADPDDPDYAFNLGYAFWQDRDTQAAIFWLREAVRRNPADGDAHFVLAAALVAAGNAVESARERELAGRLSASYEARTRRAGGDVVPRGLERVKEAVELPHAHGVERVLASSEQRSQSDLARFYLESARRAYERENDRQAAEDLNRALYLSPYLADAHLLLGRIHLRNGRVREAIDAFKIALWSAESADAHVALGEAYWQNKDAVAARAEADRALALDPGSVAARRLLAMIEGR